MGRTLSESESAELLGRFGVPVVPRRLCHSPADAVAAAQEFGFPVVAKLCGDDIAHKTERGLVRLRLGSAEDVEGAAGELLAARRDNEGDAAVLVAPMVSGHRELLCGMFRDPVFGPVVMVGVGGVLAEAIDDVAVALAPLDPATAAEVIGRLRTQSILGPWRGEAAVDLDALARCLVALGQIAVDDPTIQSIDVNPLMVDARGALVAVDALVEVADPADDAALDSPERVPPQGFDALFNPRGVVVAGASTHPGKFGFVALHNLLAGGFAGAVGIVKPDGEPVLGRSTVRSIAELPADTFDLLVVCTPQAAVPDLLEAASSKGIRAVFMATAGYGEAGPEGVAAQERLVAQCRRLGMLLAGPNGQGVVSPPVGLCAQITGPIPPAGHIAVASQSGNLVSSFLNHAVRSGVGISRAISAGNAAATDVVDYLTYFADDPETAVSVAYIEGVGDGRRWFDRLRAVADRKPVVVVKGGASAQGARAAASHTGSMASDDRIVDAALRQAGAVRAASVEHAFDTAAAFATLPLPRGGRVVVVTTVGGWGVLASDAIAASRHLRLAELSAASFAAIDALLPPRWSRNNPVDMAGGETRDTVPEVLRLLADDPEVDAVIFLGMGIQSNQANEFRRGPFFTDAAQFGLERIVAYHERQDARYAEAVRDISASTGTPVLAATELAATHPDNPGTAAMKQAGGYCFTSAERAVAALDLMVGYVEGRERRGEGPALTVRSRS